MSEPDNSTLKFVVVPIIVLLAIIFAVPYLISYPEHYIVLPFYFLFGWLTYPIKTIPLLHIQYSHVAIFLTTLSLFVLGVRRFTHWPWRRTLLLCALLMTFFGAGIAAIGTFHQTAWLANFKEPWVKDMRFGSNQEDHVYMLTHRANTQNWSNAEMQAAVNHANAKLDGSSRLVVAHDSRGNWCAILAQYKFEGQWYVERQTRDYTPPFYPKGETIEELLESCARFTPPEKEAAR